MAYMQSVLEITVSYWAFSNQFDQPNPFGQRKFSMETAISSLQSIKGTTYALVETI